MKYDFDAVINRQGSDSIKWYHYGPDVLPLWVADMDFPSPEPVVQALMQRVQQRIFGYPFDRTDLIETIRTHLQSKYNWQVKHEDIVLIPGVVTAFNLVSHALCNPGNGLLIQTPVYPPFLYAASNASLKFQEMQLSLQNDGRYTIDYEAFEQAITPETQLFILCNPHNPVGRVFTPEELSRMAEICLRHNVIICSDEIHAALIFSGSKHTPLAAMNPEFAQSTVTLMAPSKTYNIAGLECSYAVIQNPEIRRKIQTGGQGMVGFVNFMGQEAALAAYREGQEWLDQMLEYLERNRDFLYEFVNNELPGVKMAKPEGTYLAWLDCRNSTAGNEPGKFFLEKAGVAVNEGSTFGKGGEGFVRLNFGCPRTLLSDGLLRMRRALSENS